jgi:hypothetical protein
VRIFSPFVGQFGIEQVRGDDGDDGRAKAGVLALPGWCTARHKKKKSKRGNAVGVPPGVREMRLRLREGRAAGGSRTSLLFCDTRPQRRAGRGVWWRVVVEIETPLGANRGNFLGIGGTVGGR